MSAVVCSFETLQVLVERTAGVVGIGKIGNQVGLPIDRFARRQHRLAGGEALFRGSVQGPDTPSKLFEPRGIKGIRVAFLAEEGLQPFRFARLQQACNLCAVAVTAP